MPVQQMAFENIVTKGEIAQNDSLINNSIIKHLFREIFHVFANQFSKSSVADLLYAGKCLCHFTTIGLGLIFSDIKMHFALRRNSVYTLQDEWSEL